jgi:RNA polymerase sigma-70 factor (ECF subfamily)
LSRHDELDPRLLERIARRDERAFSELVNVYEARVFGLVLRMLGNRTEAEDVTHEVFIQVFKSVSTFRGDSKLSTWIYRIAVNHCKNRLKYLKVRHAHAQAELEDVADRDPLTQAKSVTVGTIERPDEAYASREIEAVVRQCILEIDPQFRECLVLRDVEELSYEEIESITGLAQGTVKSRIHRARAQLRELVEKRLGEKIR